MSLQVSIVLLLALVAYAAPISHGQMGTQTVQKVVARSSDDDVSSITEADGGVGEAHYNHKHLSPHRMMHFGKRLLVQQAPGIYTTSSNQQVLDPYRWQQAGQQQQQQQQLEQQELQSGPAFPYTILMPAEQATDNSPGLARNRQQALSVIQNLLSLPAMQRQQLLSCDDTADGSQQASAQQQVQFSRQAARFGRPKLMRLVSDSQQQQPLDSTGGEIQKKQSEQSSQSQAGQQEQQDASVTSNGRAEGDEIDRASRSLVGPSRPLMGGLTRAQFSMLFGGGQPSSSSPTAGSLLNFIKKAEPQRMTFMHFGR